MRVIIEPIALNWGDAMAFAKYRGGRLPSPAEIIQIARTRPVTVDVWCDEENHEAPETAKSWSRKYQAIKPKDKQKLCLLLFVI